MKTQAVSVYLWLTCVLMSVLHVSSFDINSSTDREALRQNFHKRALEYRQRRLDEIDTTNSTSAPSDAPSAAPTVAPLACRSTLEELNEISYIDYDADPAVKRVHYVCPGDYFRGTSDPNNPGFYIGGPDPFFARQNSEFRCGTAEEPSTDCNIIGGEWQVFIAAFFWSEPMTGVKFVGFNFETAFDGAVLGDHYGDVTFEDCTFKVCLFCLLSIVRHDRTYHTIPYLRFTQDFTSQFFSAMKTRLLDSLGLIFLSFDVAAWKLMILSQCFLLKRTLCKKPNPKALTEIFKL